MSIEKKMVGKRFFTFLHVNRKKIGKLFFQISSCQLGKIIFEACNPNQMDEPIMANGARSTRRLNKYDWLAIS